MEKLVKNGGLFNNSLSIIFEKYRCKDREFTGSTNANFLFSEKWKKKEKSAIKKKKAHIGDIGCSMDRWMRIVDYDDDDDINHCALKVTRERRWKNEEDEKLCAIGQPIDKHTMMRNRKERKEKRNERKNEEGRRWRRTKAEEKNARRVNCVNTSWLNQTVIITLVDNDGFMRCVEPGCMRHMFVR